MATRHPDEVYSKDPSQHTKGIELVLKDTYEANLTLKESKCHFEKNKLDLLGFVISGSEICAQASKTKAIQLLPQLKGLP